MTSEAIDESGENVFIFATGLGSGTARRLESESADANEPSGIGWLKPGRRTAIVRFKTDCHYSFMKSSAQSDNRARLRILAKCVRNASLDERRLWTAAWPLLTEPAVSKGASILRPIVNAFLTLTDVTKW